MKNWIMFLAIFLSGLFLTLVLDAPMWAGCMGGWAFWAAVRPREWS